MIDGKRVLAVVPARGGSRGIKLKNLREIGGIPLVGRVGLIVKESSTIDRAVVSTDHEEIMEVAQEYGLDAPFRRPEELSGDRIGDIEVLQHALTETEADDGTIYDIVVMLQPTSLGRTAVMVDKTVGKLVETQADAVWTVSQTDSKAHPLKQLVVAQDGRLGYYDLKGANIIARQQLSPIYHRNGAAYALTREAVKSGNLMAKNTHAYIIDDLLPNIDTAQDLMQAEFFMTGAQ